MTALGDQIIARARGYIGKFTDGPDVPMLAQDVAQAFPEFKTYATEAKATTAWCGIFVAKVLAEFGIKPPPTVNGTGFMYVDRWKDWGSPVPFGEAQPGDVQVFLGNPHHVNFYPGVGGNQGDAVTEHKYRTPDRIRRAPEAGPAPASKRNVNIIATVFSSLEGNKTTAYADVGPGWDKRPGVALPWRFASPRPQVRVFNHELAKSIVCDIIDQGPWNYTGSKTPGDPYWQTGARPQAESGTDQSGRKTNGAGIDLTPAAAQAIGINGKGLVDWEFTENTMPDDPTTPALPANPATPAQKSALRLLLDAMVEMELKKIEANPEELTGLIRKLIGAPATPAADPQPTPQPQPAPQPAPAAPPAPSGILEKFLAKIGGGSGATALAGIATLGVQVALNAFGIVAPPAGSTATAITQLIGALAGTASAGGGIALLGNLINAIKSRKTT